MHKARSIFIAAILVALLASAGLLASSASASSEPAKTGSVADVSTRFSASRNGFAFINHAGADSRTLLGKALIGICGGMSYAALDYYWSGSPAPASGIDRFLLARDVQSLVANGPSFLAWSLAPDVPSTGIAMGVATSTRSVSLPRLADELRKGPVALGLVKARDLKGIGRNHQVVAYAMKLYGSRVRIAIYDPNHPRSDDTYLYLDSKATDVVIESTGGVSVDAWRGFFVERYSPVVPPGA